MDSFPIWGLDIIINFKVDGLDKLTSWCQQPSDLQLYKVIRLLDRQCIKKSDCLGRVLADFYNV